MKGVLGGVIAEFVGTFALVFVGAAAIVITQGENLLVIALAHGLILSVMVSAVMHISGAQFNPAVSIALLLMGKQDGAKTGVFVVTQLIAGVVAAFLVSALMSGANDVSAVNVGATLGSLSNGIAEPVADNLVSVFVLEVIATFFLMFVIVGTAVDGRGVGKGPMIGGFGIGLTVAAAILAIGPLTGASLNPARSFGPALVAGAWSMHWVYWVAPIIGAALAGMAWKFGIGLEDDE